MDLTKAMSDTLKADVEAVKNGWAGNSVKTAANLGLPLWKVRYAAELLGYVMRGTGRNWDIEYSIPKFGLTISPKKIDLNFPKASKFVLHKEKNAILITFK